MALSSPVPTKVLAIRASVETIHGNLSKAKEVVQTTMSTGASSKVGRIMGITTLLVPMEAMVSMEALEEILEGLRKGGEQISLILMGII